MSEDGTTPEGFKRNFKGCGIVAAGLMALLLIVMVIVLYVMQSRGDQSPEDNTPAPASATQSQ